MQPQKVGEQRMPEILDAIEIQPPEIQSDLPRWCKATEVSLEIDKPDLTIQEWLDVINQLKLRDKSRQWVLGDGLNLGEERFNEEYSQAIDLSEEAEKEEEYGETYRQYMQVASRIPVGSRLPKLSWGHHQTVAYLEAERRDYWLRRALVEGLKREELRKLVKREKVKKEREEGIRASEIELLQTPEAQAWLSGLHEAVVPFQDSVPQTASFLKAMVRSFLGVVEEQSERTVESDCTKIMGLFEADKETAPYSATDDEIYKWLIGHFYFISDPELDERLESLAYHSIHEERDKEKAKEDREPCVCGSEQKRLKYVQTGGRKDGQKGDMVWVYMPFDSKVFT